MVMSGFNPSSSRASLKRGKPSDEHDRVQRRMEEQPFGRFGQRKISNYRLFQAGLRILLK
jgi:hypothetical protein